MPISMPTSDTVLTVSIEEAVTSNGFLFEISLPNGAPSDADAWQLAEAIRDSEYMATATENALTISSVQINQRVGIEEPS